MTKHLYLILLIFTASLLDAKPGPVPAEHDTLTVIQYPLVNVPLIALPGDTITIAFDLPAWEMTETLALTFKGHRTEIPFAEVSADPDNGLRRLRAALPSSMLYGLYDLEISCAGASMWDISENSVYIIPEYHSEYTFIHITDTHLPSHKFWGDTGVETDSTEMQDFREVIDDINIINPAFVLHTGDLINDGELEALGVPAISRAKRILHELDVPVFLVPGNHDLGGWDPTPAPSGTARKTWWKYFGWKHLDNTASGAVITQDYSFNYGNAHFTGMEAYALYGNYDGWRDNLYGSTSFTSGQLQWLSHDLAEHADKDLKVLFYHYDFDNDLNLSSLGVDAAFWGHIHYNSGNESASPLDLSTGAVCDDKRWYRIVKVQNNAIVEIKTVQAGTYGEKIVKTTNLDGSMVRVSNNTDVNLQKCLITFPIEEGKRLASLNNAYLMQIDTINTPHTVYAWVDVPSYGFIDASISVENIPETAISEDIPQSFSVSVFPNPFNPTLTVHAFVPGNSEIGISIFSMSGKRVHRMPVRFCSAGQHYFVWNAHDHPSGLYFIVIEAKNAAGTRQIVRKSLLMK